MNKVNEIAKEDIMLVDQPAFKDVRVERLLNAAKQLKPTIVAYDYVQNEYLWSSPLCPDIQRYYNGRLEPVIDTDEWGIGEEACVSVNHYGAACLNSRSLIILDIDVTSDTRLDKWSCCGSQEVIDRLRDLRYLDRSLENIVRQSQTNETPAEDFMAELGSAPSGKPWSDESWRLYRTLRGCRLICTSRPVATDDHQIVRLCQFLGVDGRYLQECLRQMCFRARLTPKPGDKGLFTAGLLYQVGNVIHPDLVAQITLHDAVCSPELVGPDEGDNDGVAIA